MSTPVSYDAGVAHQIGHYADAVRVPAGYDQIVVSGTPGLADNGTVSADMTGQATQAWRNVEKILAQAGAALSDIVLVRQWLIKPSDLPAYVAVRSKVLSHEPAFMLGVIPGLIRPDILVEIEVVAAVPSQGA